MNSTFAPLLAASMLCTSALVVPAAAMRRAGDKRLLDYRSAPQHPGSVVEVEAGRSMPDGLEVFGLEPGYVRVAN